MVRVCIICKKEQNPFESRSFHKFPADNDLFKKWMYAIGLSSVTKNTVICEDHFDESSFHNTNGYTVRRRLLSNAVPSTIPKNDRPQDRNIFNLINPNSSFDSDHNYTIILADINNPSLDNTSDLATNTESECSDISDKIIKEIVPFNDGDTTVNMGNTSKTCKRKFAPIEVRPTKRIRFKVGFRTEHLSRKDFASDESWKHFISYHINNKRQLITAKKRTSQRQKIINDLKSEMEIWKKLFAAVEQLDGTVGSTST